MKAKAGEPKPGTNPKVLWQGANKSPVMGGQGGPQASPKRVAQGEKKAVKH